MILVSYWCYTTRGRPAGGVFDDWAFLIRERVQATACGQLDVTTQAARTPSRPSRRRQHDEHEEMVPQQAY